MSRADKKRVLSHVTDALADESSLEANGSNIKHIARSLAYAGVDVTADELRTALYKAAQTHPSVFEPYPLISVSGGTWGSEFRIRTPRDKAKQVRKCIDAIYAVTDRLDRNGGDHLRPRAFAVAKAHMRVRWAYGKFGVPRPGTILQWIT